jgi:hypothetical protein
MQKDIMPPEKVLEAAVDQILRPILKQISTDTKHGFFATVSVMQGSKEANRFDLEHESITQSKISGEIRLRFRPTFNPSRFLVRAEAIFKKPCLANGFSGFMVKGQVIHDRHIIAKRSAWTIRYNVWEWTGW